MQTFTRLKQLQDSQTAFNSYTSTQLGYIARVVLHRTDGSDDYDDFHAEMSNIGFDQFIEGTSPTSAKVRSKLPGGMYHFDGNKPLNAYRAYTLDSITAAVSNAVAKVMADEKRYIAAANNPPSVFVIESGSARWAGLSPGPLLRRILLPKRAS